MGEKQCILVAHDFGGTVWYAFCATYPELVSCYIVCNLPHPQSIAHEQGNNWRQAFQSWYMFFFQCPIIPEFFFCHDDLNNEYLNDIANGPNYSNTDEVLEAYKYAFRNKSKQNLSTCNFTTLEYLSISQNLLLLPSITIDVHFNILNCQKLF